MSERIFQPGRGLDQQRGPAEQPRVERTPIGVDRHSPVAARIRVAHVEIGDAVWIHDMAAGPIFNRARHARKEPEETTSHAVLENPKQFLALNRCAHVAPKF